MNDYRFQVPLRYWTAALGQHRSFDVKHINSPRGHILSSDEVMIAIKLCEQSWFGASTFQTFRITSCSSDHWNEHTRLSSVYMSLYAYLRMYLYACVLMIHQFAYALQFHQAINGAARQTKEKKTLSVSCSWTNRRTETLQKVLALQHARSGLGQKGVNRVFLLFDRDKRWRCSDYRNGVNLTKYNEKFLWAMLPFKRT